MDFRSNKEFFEAINESIYNIGESWVVAFEGYIERLKMVESKTDRDELIRDMESFLAKASQITLDTQTVVDVLIKVFNK